MKVEAVSVTVSFGTRRIFLMTMAFILLAMFTHYSFSAEAQENSALEVTFSGYNLDFGNVDSQGSPYTLPNATSVIVTRSDPRERWNLYVTACDDFRSETGETFPIDRLEIAAHFPEEPGEFKKCSTSPVLLIERGTDMIPAVIDYRLIIGPDTPALPGGTRYETELVYSVTSGYLNTTYSQPAPFDPRIHKEVKIHFHLTEARSRLGLYIYDSTYSLVYNRTISSLPAGWQSITWNGRTNEGEYVPSDLYYFELVDTYPWPVSGYISVVGGTGQPASASSEGQPSGKLLYAPEISFHINPQLAYPGDLLRCRVQLSNSGTESVETVRLMLKPPGCAKILMDTVVVRGIECKSVTESDDNILFDLASLAEGEEADLLLEIAISPNATPGMHSIDAYVTSTLNSVSAPENSETSYFYVASHTLQQSGTVVGRVFLDTNNNCIMDPGETPLDGVRLVLDNSRTVECDSTGTFTVEDLIPGDYVLEVASIDLPQGCVPSFPARIVSIAPGQVARMDIPVVRGNPKQPPIEESMGNPDGKGIIKMEANPNQFSWSTRSGFTAAITDSMKLSLGLRSQGSTTAASSHAYGRLEARLGKKTQLVVGVSSDSGPGVHSSINLSGILKCTPLQGLSLSIGHSAGNTDPCLSGKYSLNLTKTMSLNAHLRLGHEGLTPAITVVYRGQAGFVSRLSYAWEETSEAEAYISIPILPGLRMKALHRWSPSQGLYEHELIHPVSRLGLSYYGLRPNLALDVDYSLTHGSKSHSLSLLATASVGDLCHISLKTSSKPELKSTSLRLTVFTPEFLDGIVTIDHERVETQDSAGSIFNHTTGVTGSFRLRQKTDASITYLVERVDLAKSHKISTQSSLVTREVRLHLDHRVAPDASLGIGIVRTLRESGNLVITSLDLRATHDFGPLARLVVGVSCPIGSWPSDHKSSERTYGPYVRLIVAGSN